MLVEDAFEIIGSINKNFLKIKETLNKTKNSAKARRGSKLLAEVEDCLKYINIEISELMSDIDESFLTQCEVGTYSIENSFFQPELGLSRIYDYLHNLDISFENVFEYFKNSPETSDREKNLVELIHKDITILVGAFNSTHDEIPKSHDLGKMNYSKTQNKLIAESMSLISKKLDSQLSEYKKVVDKSFIKFENDMNNVDAAAEREFKELNTKIQTIKKSYEATLADLEEKKEQMDEVLGQTANRVMAQDYDSSAVSEKKAANLLRFGSLACMAIIVYIVCYSFYDSTHSGFNWESSIFRTVLVFILSIPAAYLSRESTKHREQQYNYHHTALDLKAITPYIASLPEADQNRIKISIAERIFASRQTNVVQQDSFPLNTQELMMELIKKVDFKKEDKKDTQVENAGK
ncbi:hypothetical protein MTF66_33385 [Pseudoalteromonas sp. 2CM39R]|uniref:hypothetical protein n=1 Tax=Pseudoalteromonas sp. 2CM39R TaxID=2929856 RepID=UPI0020C0333D|nr:hypothetical protein [Pseudoalteromonas sp. 2CM39R]MCK8129940.1 hypothetical protein [Pseudoalteromonas sp. 2CM39R]